MTNTKIEVVHIPNDDIYNLFAIEADRLGFKWCSGRRFSDDKIHTEYINFKEGTYYHKQYYEEDCASTHEIISFTEFMKRYGEFKRGDIVIDEDGDRVEFITDLLESDVGGYRYIIKVNGEYYFCESVEKIEEPEELTMEQVCKELGRTIKIIK